MNVYIYSDESGVFDYTHNNFYVFAGVIILGKESHDEWRRKYAKVEKDVREATKAKGELKAAKLADKYKSKIFRSLNNCYKFAVIVKQAKINSQIWSNKKSKQRYLDFVYKIAIKRAFQNMIKEGILTPKDVTNLVFYVDQHNTATNGLYELREALEQEFKFGTFNDNYSRYYPPLFPGMDGVTLIYCDSSVPKSRLIRASDIIANNVFHHAEEGRIKELDSIPNLYYIIQP